MGKNLKYKSAKKTEIVRLEGNNPDFKEIDMSHFVTNKLKTYFKLFGIHNVTTHCCYSIRGDGNASKGVNDAAIRGIILIKTINVVRTIKIV